MGEKKRFIVIKALEDESFYVTRPEEAFSELDALLHDCEPDEGYRVLVKEMTEAEFEELPEFDGF